MIIQSVKKWNCVYDKTFDHYILITTDGFRMDVPKDEGNSDYQEIIKWVAEGNVIEEAD